MNVERRTLNVERSNATYPIHPLADLLPPMSEAEYAALRDSMAAPGGQRMPVILLDGMILDGRHRHPATPPSAHAEQTFDRLNPRGRGVHGPVEPLRLAELGRAPANSLAKGDRSWSPATVVWAA